MKKLFSILLIATCAFATAMAQEQSDTKSFCPNTTVDIYANPQTGYEFIGWTNDASTETTRTIVSPNNPYTVTVPSANITYYAVWGNKVFYQANPNYTQVTLNTTHPTTGASLSNPVIAETGKDYEILGATYYTTTGCYSISGYKVYAATDVQGNYDANSTPIANITLANLAEGAVPTFTLTQDVVIVPEISAGTVTVTIKSDNSSWGTVSFTAPTQNQ